MCLLNWYHVEKVGTPPKSIIGRSLACNILYKNKYKGEKKNPLLRAFLSLSLEVNLNEILFSK